MGRKMATSVPGSQQEGAAANRPQSHGSKPAPVSRQHTSPKAMATNRPRRHGDKPAPESRRQTKPTATATNRAHSHGDKPAEQTRRHDPGGRHRGLRQDGDIIPGSVPVFSPSLWGWCFCCPTGQGGGLPGSMATSPRIVSPSHRVEWPRSPGWCRRPTGWHGAPPPTVAVLPGGMVTSPQIVSPSYRAAR